MEAWFVGSSQPGPALGRDCAAGDRQIPRTAVTRRRFIHETRVVCRGPSAITALAALVPVPPAQAREPAPFGAGTLAGDRYCGFDISIAPVIDNEYQTVRTLADGTTITRITGKLVVSFTNTVTGKTIVRDVSGPTTTITHPDGTGTTVGEGNNWWTAGPVSRPIINEPALLFTTGRAVFVFGPYRGSPSLLRPAPRSQAPR
jgi:hypothetical protein